MIPLIEDNRSEIERLCQAHRVARLEVFGSAARDDFDPQRSDVDFLVEFHNIPRSDRFSTFFALQEELARLLGRPVDLVEPGGMRNPYFIRRVNESRKLVYAA